MKRIAQRKQGSGSRGTGRLIRGAFVWGFTLGVLGTARADEVSVPPSLEQLQARKQAAHLEWMHWNKLITVQTDLAQHPNEFAQSVSEAADDLRDEGRSLTVEGASMGLSGLCETGAKFAEGNWRLGKKLTAAAAVIDATQKVYVADLARGDKPASPDASLEKMVAMLKVAIQATPHKEDREKATAIVTLVTPGVEYIMAVERGDKLTAERYKELMHQVLEGMDAMVSAFIADRDPQRWARLAEVIGKRYPALNPFVDSVMAQAAMRGVVVANLLNSAANLSFGLHAWYEGLGLEAVADDIRADQQHAAGTLRLLLPHARAARESARRREERLQRLIDALQNDNPPPPPRPVPPPADILDDSKGIPPGLYVGLPTTLEVLQGSPAMTYHLTDKEVQRQEAIAEAAREAEEERERAAEREEEERQEEEAQAQRYQAWQEARADEQRNWRRRRYSPVPQGVDHTNYAGINQVISNVTGGLGD